MPTLTNKNKGVKTSKKVTSPDLASVAESPARGRAKDVAGASPARNLSGGQRRGDEYRGYRAKRLSRVPVVSLNGSPLMPTSLNRATRWIRTGRATPFVKLGILCIRMNEQVGDKIQVIVVGIDPGSKREGFTVASKHATFLNIQTEAVWWVKKRLETRHNCRRTRRNRKTPCRACRRNRKSLRNKGMPPSTHARWNWKLRLIKMLALIYPISDFVVEDIKAESKEGKRRWNASFSPLEVGKNWFYEELREIGNLTLLEGHETKGIRDSLGLVKSKKKLDDDWHAHCVDSYCLAFSTCKCPINKEILFVKQIALYRRQLHYMQPKKGGKRPPFGGTMSLGFKRGSLIRHKKYGVCCVGGAMNERISLHSRSTGARFCQNARPQDLQFITRNTLIVNS